MNACAPPPELVDLLRLWRVDPRAHVENLVRVVNASDIGVVMSGEESFTELAQIVTDVERTLRLEQITGSELQDEAVAAMCRRLGTGAVTPRELTYWVTRVIGWRGTARTRPLLGLEQDYCDLPLTDEEIAMLDGRVRTVARDLLADPAVDEVRPKLQRVRQLLRRPARDGRMR